MAGLWYGKEKPFMLTFLHPIVEQLNSLYTKGKATTNVNSWEVRRFIMQHAIYSIVDGSLNIC